MWVQPENLSWSSNVSHFSMKSLFLHFTKYICYRSCEISHAKTFKMPAVYCLLHSSLDGKNILDSKYLYILFAYEKAC